MSEFTLKAEPFLGGFQKSFGSTDLREVTDLEIVSVSCPIGGLDPLRTRIESVFGTALPGPGFSSGSISDGALFVWMSPDQWFAVTESGSQPALGQFQDKIGPLGYFTSQTDNWAVLRLDGDIALPALERICPIDLHPSVFPPRSAARTVMEHLGTLICCEDRNRYLLLSASSSARSFLHAVETSIQYVT